MSAAARADRSGVWAANDPIALDAIEALRAHRLQPGIDIGVVGLNWSPEALTAISQGTLLMSDGGRFFAGAWAMVVLCDLFDGVGYPGSARTLRFQMSPVNAANIEAFRAALGDIIVRSAFDGIDFSRFLISKYGDPSDYDFSVPALIAAIRSGQKDCAGSCASLSVH
ncbi:hypothetical protein [Breoghania sp.]|uniref:hypothetical protein n=1 Tax=Breoghania sp. TaxID=2065378 RepID=UPI00261094CB|nr:hypothetical protein [Breoghania sp.]MDJ0932033.1 hypothetical protein [Breoghania sp.]